MCCKCGISRPTLRKRIRRYKKNGLPRLSEKSCILSNSPKRKVFDKEERFILLLRKGRKLGLI